MKKIIALLTMIILASSLTAFAAEPEIAIIQPIGEPSESGYQAYGLFDADGNPIKPAEREECISLFADPLPESYDSRDYGYISPIRNQGSFGTCWAHAFVACAEANMIKKGYEEQFNNYSELHLAYFYHKRNETQGDGVDVFDAENGYGYFGGGNGYYAAQFAENFQDLAVESDFPYSLASNSSVFSIDEHFRNHSDVHMVDFGVLNSAEEAKRAIMEYGSFSLGYASLNGYLSENFGYYQNVTSGTNHEVAVVGWDDNFPVESFNESCRPSKPGAWLVKNSYGKMYGDFGYIWLSYEDPSILLGNYYEFEPIGDESKVHSYNGGIAAIMWNVPSAANVFEVKEDQTLYAVGFDSVTNTIVPEKYEIKIYVSNSKPNRPNKGSLKTTLTGSITHDGFNHIELDSPIKLTEGQYFSVIVKQTDSSGNYAASMFEEGSSFTSHEGESYFLNGIWQDSHNYSISGYTLKNATIKAYYKTNTATVTFNTRKSGEFDTQTVVVGECITKPEDPVMDGYEFLGWYTNNTVTEEWDFSTPVQHDMILFAKWAEPENIDMKIKSEYFSESYMPNFSVTADNIKNFTIYFAKDQKPYTFFPVMYPSNLGIWYVPNSPTPSGEYTIFTDVTGVNGEEITSDIEAFTVTDQPALSVHEGYVNIVNIPESGVDLYVAQYDDGGNILSVTKRQFKQSSTDYISINAPTTYSNPRFFLWDTATTAPLCQPD